MHEEPKVPNFASRELMRHDIELVPGKGAQIVRSAGTSAQLLAKEGDHAQVRLPSGEVRRVDMRCMATIGQVGNIDHDNLARLQLGEQDLLGQQILENVEGGPLDEVDEVVDQRERELGDVAEQRSEVTNQNVDVIAERYGCHRVHGEFH